MVDNYVDWDLLHHAAKWFIHVNPCNKNGCKVDSEIDLWSF
jgi:hypothetical protein